MIHKIGRINRKKIRTAFRVFLIMILILLITPRLTLENIMNHEPVSLPLTMLAFFIIYAIKPIIMIIPVNMLYITAGLIFPAGWSILITYLCLAAALSVGYINGKKLGQNKVNEVLDKNKKAAVFLDNQKNNLLSMCFIVRLLPFPKDLFSMFFGAVGMPFYKYLVISLIGISPVMISTVLAGAYISTPLSPEFLVPFGASLAIILVLFIIYRVLNKRKHKNI